MTGPRFEVIAAPSEVTGKIGPVTKYKRCSKKLTLFYFWSNRFEANRTRAYKYGAHALQVLKPSGKKINKC